MIGGQRLKENIVLTNSLELEIGKGNISGYTGFFGFGEKQVLLVNTRGQDIWSGSASTIPIPSQLGGEAIQVFSANHDDRLNGTGINIIRLHYLDGAGNEQTENINLNGTVLVNSVGTNIRFINNVYSILSGVGGVASGTVSVVAYGTSATVYNEIPAFGNASVSSFKMIPKNKTFYLTNWNVSVGVVSSIVRLRSNVFNGTRYGTTFIFQDSFLGNNSSLARKFSIPIKLPEFSLLKCSGYTTAAGGYISVNYDGILINNS